MEKDKNDIEEVEITEEEKKKKRLAVKVAIFVGCLVLAGVGITIGVLIKKNKLHQINQL